jgi:hypothetical protein
MHQDYNEIKEGITLNRTGNPPIRFTGSLIGYADNEFVGGNRANRWSQVTIYRTKGGNYVAYVSAFTCWQGESDYFKGESFANASEVIEYLKDHADRLGKVSQEAIEGACENDIEFKLAFVQEVE